MGNVGETTSMHKEVVLGGDVWDLLDELMIYMQNPMQYYEKGVQFVRVNLPIFFFFPFFHAGKAWAAVALLSESKEMKLTS